MGKIVNLGKTSIFINGKEIKGFQSVYFNDNEVPLYDRGKLVGHMDVSPLTDEIGRLSGTRTGRWSSKEVHGSFRPISDCSHDWEYYEGVMSRDWTCRKCGKRVTDDPTGGRE